ncbi:MAG: zinc ribbon domain-containing protein [Candidatus Hodarchaeota archaeon]
MKKDTFRCPNCNQIGPKLKYCLNCGAKNEQYENSPTNMSSGKQICPQCQKMNPDDYKFCAFCSTQLKLPLNENSQASFEGFKISSEKIDWQKKQKVNIRDFRTTQLPIYAETIKIGHFSFAAPSRSQLQVLKQQFSGGNLIHYTAAFLFVLAIYSFWFTCWFLFDQKNIFGFFELLFQSPRLIIPSNPLLVVLEILLISSLLFAVSFAPIFLSTFYVLKQSQILVLFRINGRLLIFSALFSVIAPILLPPGVLTLREKNLSLGTKNIQKSIAIASTVQVLTTASFLFFVLLGTFFSNSFFGVFKDRFLLIYIFTTWICVFTIVPWVSPFGKLLQQWNTRFFWLLIVLCVIFVLFSFVPLEIL